MPEQRRSVLVTGTSIVPDNVLADIESKGFQVRRLRQDHFESDELDLALDSMSGYLIGGDESPTAANFEAAELLEAVAFVGTDYQTLVEGWERAYQLGIAFANCPGANAVAVAEFTMTLMLTMARPFTERISRPGAIDAAPGTPGRELRNRTLGIIGAGRIGARVASIARSGFGMRVVYHAPHRNEPLELAVPLEYMSMDELLSVSDIISLHRPGTVIGSEAFGERDFAQMRPGAVLVNAGHPLLVDPEALLVAVQDRGIRAAFDGHDVGPAWERLIALGPEKFLCVPSMAYNTAEANRNASTLAANAVCTVLAGGESPLVRNPDFLEVRRSIGRLAAPDHSTRLARSATARPS